MARLERTPQRVIEVKAWCPECVRSLAFDGRIYPTSPRGYPHTCPGCGYTEVLAQVSPWIEYEGEA